MRNTTNAELTILGAGTIGCYVGGMLINSEFSIKFLGREELGTKISQSGMDLTDCDGHRIKLDANIINWSSQPQTLKNAKAILLCTKSVDTKRSAELIKQYCRPDILIISVQNGVGNSPMIKNILPEAEVLSAMVSFNVVRIDDTPVRFHRGTEGEIIFEHHPISQRISGSLRNCGVNSSTTSDMQPIAWGKLLLNLNNAINVISGLPLKRQLQTREWRLILALSVEEALGILKQSKIKPARIGKVPPVFIPAILRLPNLAFKLVAQSMLKIDDDARSSMWEDLQAGRKSEIDYLNGAICRLGKECGLPTPINDLLANNVKNLFEQQKVKHPSAREILQLISNNATN